MKNKTLELKTAIIVAVITMLFVGAVLGMFLLFEKISDEKQADFWFDVSLSFITSLFSAGIAYVVALMQIKSAKKMEDNEREIQNKKDINLVLIEMKDNLEVLEILINYLDSEDGSDIENVYDQFSTDMWNRLVNKIDISNDLMAQLLNVIKKKELVFCDQSPEIKELIDYKKEYQSVYDSLSDYMK